MIHAIKGINDVLPAATDSFLDSAVWQHVHAVAGRVLGAYGYRPVWLPVLEDTALFSRSIGTDTDIVDKEMYSLTDRGGRAMTLRPEGTAGAARAYLEHGRAQADSVQRWFYAGPMFRAERPQKGRYRQFYQIGAELFGVADVAADVEMVAMLTALCAALGLTDLTVRLNTLGDADSRAAWRTALTAYFTRRTEGLCENCRARLSRNVLRLLDCKRPGCRAIVSDAPDILDALTPPARAAWDRAVGLLSSAGVAFTRDPLLVRGLDYYTGIIFEFTTGALGAQDAILGGGRYDGLVATLGGPPTPAVGFAAGVERLALLVAATPGGVAPAGPHCYLIPMDDAALSAALALATAVRALGPWRIEVDLAGGRLKAQMRRADRAGAATALVLGSAELAGAPAKLKRLVDGHVAPTPADPAALAAALGHMLG